MEVNLDEIRNLLVGVFQGANDYEEKLLAYKKEDILNAAKLQNEILNHAISYSNENYEDRLLHLNFYYNFNTWFIAFEEGKLNDKNS